MRPVDQSPVSVMTGLHNTGDRHRYWVATTLGSERQSAKLGCGQCSRGANKRTNKQGEEGARPVRKMGAGGTRWVFSVGAASGGGAGAPRPGGRDGPPWRGREQGWPLTGRGPGTSRRRRAPAGSGGCVCVWTSQWWVAKQHAMVGQPWRQAAQPARQPSPSPRHKIKINKRKSSPRRAP